MDANYWNDENVWLFWEAVFAIAVLAFMVVRHFWIKCKRVTTAPDRCDPMNETEPTEKPTMLSDAEKTN